MGSKGRASARASPPAGGHTHTRAPPEDGWRVRPPGAGPRRPLRYPLGLESGVQLVGGPALLRDPEAQAMGVAGGDDRQALVYEARGRAGHTPTAGARAKQVEARPLRTIGGLRGVGRDALEAKGPQRRPRRQLDRRLEGRLEGVAEAVGDG